MGGPIFSLAVVTVVKDDVAGLLRTLNSVSMQSVLPSELIVVDSSSLEYRDQIRRLVSERGGRYVWEDPTGIYSAMNKGIGMVVTATWTMFVNAGDWLAGPYVLSDLARKLSHGGQDSYSMVGTTIGIDSGKLVRMSPTSPARQSKKFLRLGVSRFPHPSFVFVSQTLAEQGGFDRRLQIAADYLLALKMVISGGVIVVDRVISVHKLDGKSSKFPLRSMVEQIFARLVLFGPSQLLIELSWGLPRLMVSYLHKKFQGFFPSRAFRKFDESDVEDSLHFCKEPRGAYMLHWPECCEHVLSSPPSPKL